ncbi:RNA cap guanine-N2 methyltransferase [Aureococcus anophagefferens]|nr:RNA cap guanine-N2 methyltransferase [Aureococcus anophagefferens]
MAESSASQTAASRAVEVSDGKRFQLWGTQCSEAARKGMLLDEVAVYSVTDARTADRITKLALKLPGAPFSEICDGCACVGGNVLSFARALARAPGATRVTGVELDATRFEFLKHNVETAGLDATCLHGDIAAATAAEEPAEVSGDLAAARAAVRRADLLFLDPPWGGPEVSARPMGSVSFDMSGVDLAALCARCNAPGFRCKHVLLKLPNYDTPLKAALKGVADVRLETALRKMILAVLFDSACKPDAPYSTQGSGDGGDDDLGIDFEDAWDATGATASTRPQAYSEAFSDDSVHRRATDADKFLLSPGSTGDLTRMGLKEYHSPYFNTEKRSVVAQRADGERETGGALAVHHALVLENADGAAVVSVVSAAGFSHGYGGPRPAPRVAREATLAYWGVAPLVWQAHALVSLEARMRFQEGHGDDFESIPYVDHGKAAYRRWLRDERNGAFAARYDRDRAASVDAKGHGARFTKAAIELVVVLYLVKVIPDSYHKFFFPSHSKDGVDRLISIRALVARKEADTVLMKIGYRLHTFMNSAFEVLLYSLNMYLLFYHDSPLEVILNSLMIEFILDLDEYLADSPHIDTNFRYLRSAAVEMVLLLYVPKKSLKELKITGPKERRFADGRKDARARNDDAVDASLQEYYGEKDVERYGLFARFGQRHGIGHWKKGIFNRYASYRTGEALPRWLEILFKPGDAHHYEKALATSVPYGTLEGFQVEGVRTLRRFIEHNAPGLVATINRALLGDVLKTATCQRIWSAIRGYNGDGEPLVGCGKARRCLVVVDALRVRDRVGVALRVPRDRAGRVREMVSLPPPRTCSRRSLTIGPPCWLEWLVIVRLRPSPEMTVDELIIVKDPPPPPAPRSWSRSMSMSPPKPPSMPPPIIWSMRAKGRAARGAGRRRGGRRGPAPPGGP